VEGGGGGEESALYKSDPVHLHRRNFLENWSLLPSSYLERAEDLEQLKLLEAGHVISVCC
jgi:CMP-2-keto-3-deoxyoctulosonic acid synthetase